MLYWSDPAECSLVFPKDGENDGCRKVAGCGSVKTANSHRVKAEAGD